MIGRTLLRRIGALALTGAAATAIVTAAASPAQAAPLFYSALGDSYSSGVGAGDYDPSDPDCYKSAHAYPEQIAYKAVLGLTFLACSGATTDDVTANQLSGINGASEYVTIGIGGNDAGFTRVLTACAGTDTALCLSAIDGAEATITGTLPGKLDGIYDAIKAKAPQSWRVAVGYPHLFSGATCAGTLGITPEEQAALNDTTDLLNDTIAAQASANGFAFADPRAAFAGHELCSADPYFLAYVGTLESFHPNAAGQGAYTDVVFAKM